MGFLSEYGTARETERTLDDQALARQRQVVADTGAAQARMEKLRQAEILRRMPTQEALPDTSQIQWGTTGGPASTASTVAAPAAAAKPVADAGNMGAYVPRAGTGRKAAIPPTKPEPERTHLWHAEGSDPNLNTPYGESVGKALAFVPNLIASGAKHLISAPGYGLQSPKAKATPEQLRMDALRSEEAARTGGAADQAAAQARRAAAPTPGTDFISRIRQAESGGNMAAIGPNVPGQGTAKSDMQVMDRTSGDPGYGVRPAQNNSVEERSRVGRDYAQAMLNRYGNEAEAAAAYNWGPGNYDRWKASGANLAQMPAETRNYVAKVTGQQAAGGAPAQQVPGAPTAAAPETPISRVIASGGFTPEQLSNMAGQQGRMAQFKMQQIQQLAQVTNDPKQLQQYQDSYADLLYSVREAHFANLYAQDKLSDTEYAQISEQERARAQAAAAERRKVALKAEGEIAVADAQGVNARMLEQQKAIAEAAKIFGGTEGLKIVSPDDGKTIFVTRGNQVLRYIPGVMTPVGMSESSMVPVKMGS
jgi:hypothetical protein